MWERGGNPFHFLGKCLATMMTWSHIIRLCTIQYKMLSPSNILQFVKTSLSFFRDLDYTGDVHPDEPVPEENFWILWCKERLTEADTLTIRQGATPSELTSAHLHHPPYPKCKVR